MENASIEKRVFSVVAKQFGIRESEITREARFRDDLGVDFLDVMEFLVMEFTGKSLTYPSPTRMQKSFLLSAKPSTTSAPK